MNNNMSNYRRKENVYVGVLCQAQVYGDKIVIHKSDIDRAIKSVKHDPDPFGEPDRRYGQLDVLRSMQYAIKDGMKRIREKESRKK